MSWFRQIAARLIAALLAGSVAIVLNTLALKIADLVPLATAKGGLLRLITPWLSLPLEQLGIASLWSTLGGPTHDSQAFQTGFLFVGIMMALFYAFVLEPLLPGGAWIKGSIYAAALWILNAVVILPATGEGFAGSAHLSLAGMIWFASAHTLFFLALAFGFAKLFGEPQHAHTHRLLDAAPDAEWLRRERHYPNE
jgi:hypothetical protein